MELKYGQNKRFKYIYKFKKLLARNFKLNEYITKQFKLLMLTCAINRNHDNSSNQTQSNNNCDCNAYTNKQLVFENRTGVEAFAECRWFICGLL